MLNGVQKFVEIINRPVLSEFFFRVKQERVHPAIFGGAIRDTFLLNSMPKDIDMVVKNSS